MKLKKPEYIFRYTGDMPENECTVYCFVCKERHTLKNKDLYIAAYKNKIKLACKNVLSL